MGGFCDDHDYCYITAGAAKDACDEHFHEQMKAACEALVPAGLERTNCLVEAGTMYAAVSAAPIAQERFDGKQARRNEWHAMKFDPSLGFTRDGGRRSWLIQAAAAGKHLENVSGDQLILSDAPPTPSSSVWRYYVDESIRPVSNPRKCVTRTVDGSGLVKLEDCIAPNRHMVGYHGTTEDLVANTRQRFGYDNTRRRLCVYHAAYCSEPECATQEKRSCVETDGDTGPCVAVVDDQLRLRPCGDSSSQAGWQFVPDDLVVPTTTTSTTVASTTTSVTAPPPTTTTVTSTTITTLVSERFMWGDDKGKDATDCYIGLVGYSKSDATWQPINKKGSKWGVVCTECDPACDFDGTQNGVCEFAIGFFRQKSGHASCDPGTLAFKKLKAKAKAKGVKLDLLRELCVPLCDAGFVSELVPFRVSLKGKKRNKAGNGTVKLLVKKPTDKDTFHFRCEPLPEGGSCPVPTTTSTTLMSGCFQDWGDGTIRDTCTGLQWEKKLTDFGSGANAGNLADVDNKYTWAGVCSMGGALCQPDAAAAATCQAQTAGAVGCTVCGMADGTCDVDPRGGGAITTIWDWINEVNAVGLAGHSDWRLATIEEFESIRDVGEGVCGGGNGPCIAPIFGPTAWFYWSSETFADNPGSALELVLADGPDVVVGIAAKDFHDWVRAVRSGP